MAEIRLAVEEKDRGLSLGTEDQQRPHIDGAREQHRDRRWYSDPRHHPAKDAAGEPNGIARSVVVAHRWSCFMNCAIGDASVRSSTNRIADLGTSIREDGAWSSLPRRTSLVSG